MNDGLSGGGAAAEGSLGSKAAPEDGAVPLLLRAVRDLEAALEETTLQIGNAARIASQAENALLSITNQITANRSAVPENADWSLRMIAEVGDDLRRMAFASLGSSGTYRAGRNAGAATSMRALSDTLQKAVGGLNSYIARLQGEARHYATVAEKITPLLNQVRPVFSALQAAAQERDARISGLSDNVATLVARMGGRTGDTCAAAESAWRDRGRAPEKDGPKGRERRRHVRHAIRLPVVLQWDRTAYACHSVDVSEGGMLVTAGEDFNIPVGTIVHGKSDQLGSFSATIVGRSKRGIHLRFALPAAR